MEEVEINEGHIRGLVADMKVHLGVGDFKNALKRIEELKKCVKELRGNRKCHA